MVEHSPLDWLILVGPGERLEGLAPVLGLLASGVGGNADSQRTGARVERLSDPARLPSGSSGAGRLILDADQIALEDIGLVRRFLVENPDWELRIVGQDGHRQTARSLLTLPRARWLFWPLDLEQVTALLAPATMRPGQETSSTSLAAKPAVETASRAPADRAHPPGSERSSQLRSQVGALADIAQRLELSFGALRESAHLSNPQAEGLTGELRRLHRFTRSLAALVAPPARGQEEFDVDALLEEELAVLALRQRKSPRFKYRGGEALSVRADRAALREAVESLLLLARHCATEGEQVRVESSRSGPGELQIGIEFPPGPLAGLAAKELLLPGAVRDRLPDFDESTLAAAEALIVSQGGCLSVLKLPEGSLNFDVRLPVAAATTSPRQQRSSGEPRANVTARPVSGTGKSLLGAGHPEQREVPSS